MREQILSLSVNTGTKEFYINKLVDQIIEKQSGYICFCNVHMLIEAHNDSEFATVINNSTITFPDGMPIAKSFKWLHNLNQERIAGMDFLPDFLEVCHNKKFKIAFVGGTDELLMQAKNKIHTLFPNIEITALISPPFNKPWDNKSYINIINQNKTDVVFVALGCPKQEKWMSENSANCSSMLFGIGGALPAFTDSVRRAPKWMQDYSLEWLFRFLMEPKRLFKRYLFTNTKFILLILKEKLNS